MSLRAARTSLKFLVYALAYGLAAAMMLSHKAEQGTKEDGQ